MSSLTFGLTMLVVGMGGTMVTLGLLAFLLRRLTALFPADERKDREAEHATASNGDE